MRVFWCNICSLSSLVFARNISLRATYTTQATKISEYACNHSKNKVKDEKKSQESIKTTEKLRSKMYAAELGKRPSIQFQSVQKKKMLPFKFPKSRSSFLDRRIDQIAAFASRSDSPKSSIETLSSGQSPMYLKIDERAHAISCSDQATSDKTRISEIIELCNKLLDRAVYLHMQKGKPHLALTVYREARQKLILEKCVSCDAISDAFIRIDINYAKCIEECYEHLIDVHRSCFDAFKDITTSSGPCIEPQTSKMKIMWRAIWLYSEAVEQLVDRGKGRHSVRLQLRLAECYEKIGMLSKAKETIKACEIYIPTASNNQYDVGVSLFTEWNLPLYDIFEAYYCKGFENCITALQAHIEDPADLSREAILYANIFFARRSLLQNRRLRQVGNAFENVLKIRPKSFSLNLEFAHFLQFIHSNPRSSIKWYMQSITIMRKNLDWPGMKKWILPQALHNLANAHITIGQPEEAHPLLFEAKALYCTDRSNNAKVYKVRLMLAKALEDCGDIDQASFMYTKIFNFVNQSERCKTVLQIDIMNQQTLLNAGEVYCRFAVFLKSISRTAEAEQLFAKTLSHEKTQLATKIECLYSYSDLLRVAGKILHADLMDDHLFSTVMQNHGSVIRLPWKTWKGRIRQLESSGRHEQILEIYSFLINAERCTFSPSEYSDILRRYAEYLQGIELYSEASIMYGKCIRTNELNIYYHVQKAWCSAKAKTSSIDAEEYFHSAIKLYEESKEKEKWDGCFCYGEFGVFLHENNNQAEAEKAYIKAIQSVNANQSTNFAQVCANLGILYHVQGKVEDREKCFSEVFEHRHPRYVPWLLCLDTYISAHRVDEGNKIAKRMIQLFPDQQSAIFLRMGKLFEMDTPVVPVRVAYAFYMAMKMESTYAKTDIAEGSLEKVYENTKNVHALAEFAATLNYKMHLYKDAEICYKILRQRLPDDVNIALHYGKLAFDRLDKPYVARCEFEHALQIDPGNLLAYEYLAEYYALIESDSDAAEDCYLQALRLKNGANYVNTCYRFALFLQNHQASPVNVQGIFDNLQKLFPKDNHALIAHAIYLQLSLDEGHKTIAKIKFAQQNRPSDVDSTGKLSIKDFLSGKQLEWRTKECSTRIDKIAGAIQTAARNDICPNTMDVSNSLRRRNSTLYKKTRENITDSMLHWRFSDFLTDPVHHFVLQFENKDVDAQLSSEQRTRWQELSEIDRVFKDAILLAPNDIGHLQQYGNFLATWMMNLTEAGKMYLKAIHLQPFNIDLLRSVVSFFHRHGYEQNIHAFLDIAKNVFEEILQNPAHTAEDILQFTNFLQTVHDERALEDVYVQLSSIVESKSMEGENLGSTLQKQHDIESKDGQKTVLNQNKKCCKRK